MAEGEVLSGRASWADGLGVELFLLVGVNCPVDEDVRFLGRLKRAGGSWVSSAQRRRRAVLSCALPRRLLAADT